MIKVLIVEDQRMPRESMEREIKENEEFSLVGSLSAAGFAIGVLKRERVDLILMDVCTNGDMDGIDAAAEIKRLYPETRIIIITSMMEVSYIERAKAAGADSFWYKDESRESLMEVIYRTMAGESLYPERTPEVQIGLASSGELTPTEIKVLRLVCNGLEYDEMAEKLGCSRNTVKTHVSHLLQKTGYPNRIRLAIAVTNKKFIIPDTKM